MSSGRLPFRAADLRRSDQPVEEDRPLSVSVLASLVERALRERLPATVRVTGEVSGFRERTHWYFDLKDEGAVVNCVVFASQARRHGFVPEQGQQVVVSGRVDYYAKAGKLSLIATKVEPVGRGAHELELKRLTEEFRSLGWLDVERKLALPAFPRRIAVVTSRSSAALQDVIDTVRRRAPFVDLVTVDARVQGESAGPELARAIGLVGRQSDSLGLDALIVTRGGGSVEDLWCFNSRDVCRAIVECGVPVVAAIGHETDTTLAELVADERAATPTQAAMRLTPDANSVQEQLSALDRRLRRSISDSVGAHARSLERAGDSLGRSVRARQADRVRKLDQLGFRLERARPDRSAARVVRSDAARLASCELTLRHAALEMLRRHQQRAMRARELLERVGKRLVQDACETLDGFDRELHAVNPLEVLRRGYSVTVGPDGTVVREPSVLKPGDRLTTLLAGGELRSLVEADGGRPSALPASPPRSVRRPRRRSSDPSQLDLFGGAEYRQDDDPRAAGGGSE